MRKDTENNERLVVEHSKRSSICGVCAGMVLWSLLPLTKQAILNTVENAL
ncbi:MAG: hypothetical protein JWQ87_3761 [Candidatus Sulfotelmatobacter sp.]|nr:hypothetical protein [Candidatus Sulfotelmatobacter sp.]